MASEGAILLTMEVLLQLLYHTLALIQAQLLYCWFLCIYLCADKAQQIPVTNYMQLLLHTVHWVCLVSFTSTALM